MTQVYLTFDVEDYINSRSTEALKQMLKLLNSYDLRGLFFITGSYAEEVLKKYPDVVGLLGNHVVGYHSSSHSIHPLIVEYTDVAEYERAVDVSTKRETSHIDPLSGRILGDGGLDTLKDLFRGKDVSVYRGPGFSWTAPHLDALKKLGIKFDFTAEFLSDSIVYYKGITFHPKPLLFTEELNDTKLGTLIESINSMSLTVIGTHVEQYSNAGWWDSIYYKGNPPKLSGTPPLDAKEKERRFRLIETLFSRLSTMQDKGMIEVTPALKRSQIELNVKKANMLQAYMTSVGWGEYFFDYNPRFLYRHFRSYFNLPAIN